MRMIEKRITWVMSIAFMVAFMLVLQSGKTVQAAETTTVKVEGSYYADIAAALNRINEIRLEACQEGVPNPANPGTSLTVADYVPIKWSADLEEIARLRAAEASLVVSHTRPNGYSCFTAASSNGVRTYGEVLAWNYSTSMIPGINQWYGEKSAWVNRNSNAVTGHYTSMIDPDNTYVGLGCFGNQNGVYPTTTAGEFLSTSYALDETQGAAVSNTAVDIEIQKTALSAPTVISTKNEKSTFVYSINDTDSLRLALTSTLEGDTTQVYDGGTVTWTSSDSNVAAVDADGNFTAKGMGTATITASSTSGYSATVTINVRVAVGTVFSSDGLEYKVTDNTDCYVTVQGIVSGASTPSALSIPDSVVTGGTTFKVIQIAASAFKGNQGIVNVTIGNNVKTIGVQAFALCKSLRSVTIGSGVQTIGNKAFFKAKKLKNIRIQSLVLRKVGGKAIKGIKKKAVIRVPAVRKKAYQKLFKSKTGYRKTMKIKKL